MGGWWVYLHNSVSSGPFWDLILSWELKLRCQNSHLRWDSEDQGPGSLTILHFSTSPLFDLFAQYLIWFQICSGISHFENFVPIHCHNKTWKLHKNRDIYSVSQNNPKMPYRHGAFIRDYWETSNTVETKLRLIKEVTWHNGAMAYGQT